MIYRLWNRRKREVDLEPPPVGNRDRQFRGLFAGVPLIVGLVVITLGVLLLFMHSQFMGRVAQCRESYNTDPDMQIVSEQPPYFLQPFGSLTTELHSTESAEQVQDRLNRARAALQREAVVSGDFRNLPEQSWIVFEAEDGGSRITLTCP
jgi:hypothetical protein